MRESDSSVSAAGNSKIGLVLDMPDSRVSELPDHLSDFSITAVLNDQGFKVTECLI
jgi:hypothetical protein